jgi:hypothetical protein
MKRLLARRPNQKVAVASSKSAGITFSVYSTTRSLGDEKLKARIASVINSDSGETVKVKGTVFYDDQPVIEVTSSFLYRGRFTNFENMCEIVDEPDYVVTLSTHADVRVLNSKEWFQRDDGTKPLLPGTSLTFRVQSDIAFPNKTAFASLSAMGDVYVRDQLKQLIKVATVKRRTISWQHGSYLPSTTWSSPRGMSSIRYSGVFAYVT